MATKKKLKINMKNKRPLGTVVGWMAMAGKKLPLPDVDENGQAGDLVEPDVGVDDDENDETDLALSDLKVSDIISFNRTAEKKFIVIVRELIADEGEPQTVRTVTAEGAFELNISVETAKRYLLKHSARRAEFRVDTDGVWLR